MIEPCLESTIYTHIAERNVGMQVIDSLAHTHG